jgi:hypothetical protein
MVHYLETGLIPDTDTRHLTHLLSRHAPNLPESELNQLASVISELLNTIPGNIRLINAYQTHPLCRKPLGFAFGEILRYCFDENDLLPEQDFGSLGLIDDAYLLHSFAGLLPIYFPFAVPDQKAGPEFNSRDAVDKLLPTGILDTLDKTARSVLEISIAFFAGGMPEATGDGEKITLNVEGAASLLVKK